MAILARYLRKIELKQNRMYALEREEARHQTLIVSLNQIHARNTFLFNASKYDAALLHLLKN